MAVTSRLTDRPRSFVSHLIHLADADPAVARKFIEASGYTAIKRLGIRPALKASTRTTVAGRHIELSVIDKETGEKTIRHARRRKPLKVHRYTRDQVAVVLADMKPRKAEYKVLRETALTTLASTEGTVRLRRLPRHKKWSKRRNRR